MMIMKKILSLFSFLAVFFTSSADDAVFQRPSAKMLVVDNANAFYDWQLELLTAKLDSFEMATSTQIQIYTTTDLHGYSIADFGQRLGEGWGVGQESFNNGIVIIYKPKTETEDGEVTIQTGYGIEPLIPDAICKRIIENEMIPCFRDGYVYRGIDKAVNVCISLTKGEFSAEDYVGSSSNYYSSYDDYGSGSSYEELEARDYVVVVLFFVFMIVSVILSTRYANKHPSKVTYSGGSRSSYSSGRSGSYGGGHFGGGGASGRW